MFTAFQQFVEKEQLFNPKTKLLLAFSGGADSVCLFYLLLKGGYTFSVAHCNFNLRGKESIGDEKFISALAKKYKIECFIQNFDTKKEMAKHKLSVQEAARNLRYQWFETLMQTHQFDKLLTAHHLTDNAETMLINILRGTGIKGLHGILFHKEKIGRPLMFASKAEILTFVNQQKIKFREDSSNASDNYLRNNLRHHILPQLETINPNFEQQFFNTAQQLYQFENLAYELIKKQWDKLIIKEKENVIIDCKKLYNIENKKTFLFYTLQPYGFNMPQVEEMLLNKEHKVGRIFLSDNYSLLQERHIWVLKSKSFKIKNEAKQYILEINNTIEINGLIIGLKTMKNNEKINFKQKNKLFLNAENIQLPLNIRPWQAGDYIVPFGMIGKQKISNFLTNKKLTKTEKENTLVVVNEAKKIIAIIPFTVHNNYSVLPETKNILAISYKNR